MFSVFLVSGATTIFTLFFMIFIFENKESCYTPLLLIKSNIFTNAFLLLNPEKRNNDGVPYLIHNWGLGTKEDLQYWGDIRGHYRL